MTHSHPKLFSGTVFLAGAVTAAVLSLAPSAALAQRGSSAHMGGGGGTGHLGGGGSTAGSHPAATTSHPSAKPATRSAPVTDSRRPVSTSAKNGTTGDAVAHPSLAGAQASPASDAAPLAVHGNSTAPRTSVIGYPPTEASPWQAAAQSHSGAVSFSGQGHEIWEDSPSRNSNSAASSGQSVVNQPQFRAAVTPALIARPTPPHKVTYPFGSAPFVFVPAYGYFGPAYGFGYFGNGFGCNPFSSWGCGGLGYGFGYGSAFGYGGYYGAGYGYDPGPGYDTSLGPVDFSGDASSDGYGPDSSGNRPGYDSSAPTNGDGSSNDTGAAPMVTTAPATTDSAPPATSIFLKDGSSFEVMSYWLDAGKLHYITNYGGESSIDITQLDLQRTVDENAQRGGSFTLRPAAAVPAPDAAPAPEPQPQQ